MTDQCYSFVINSRDKIAGTNNAATYNLMFSILPREYQYYKVAFCFNTDAAFFTDTYDSVSGVDILYSSQIGHITTPLLLQASMMTDNSPSNTLGFIERSPSTQNSTATNHICYIKADKTTNQEIVVLRPAIDQININVNVGSGNIPFVSTNVSGVLEDDLPPYIMILQFTPVKDFRTS